MIELLREQNSATRFQILVEIANSGPNVYQRSIAAKLGISPQAVSDYIQQLTKDDFLEVTGRSSYRVSVKGVNWMLRMLRELRDFVSEAAQSVTNITICAAIAECDLAKGQPVGLSMKDGLLFATSRPQSGARGVAATSAQQGEDVGISNVEGVVEINPGKVTVLEVPAIQDGGSRQADLERLKVQLVTGRQVGAIGIEALVALKRAGTEPRYVFGVAEAAIEEARCNLPFLIVSTADAVPGLIKKLQESSVDYELISPAPGGDAILPNPK